MKGFSMKGLIVFTFFLMGCTATSSNLFDFQSTDKTKAETSIEDFKSRVGYLASDKLGGRSAGSKGDLLARDYMVDLFETSASVTVQEFEVITNRRTNETATTLTLLVFYLEMTRY
jgi:hypothetical protein